MHPNSIHYHNFTPRKFFTSALADGFTMESEWQQFYSSLQDSSQYSGQTERSFSLYSLHPSRYFRVLPSLNQTFGDYTNYLWCNPHFHVPQFFNSLARYLYHFLHSLNSTLRSTGKAKFTLLLVLSFFVDYFYKFWSSGRD